MTTTLAREATVGFIVATPTPPHIVCPDWCRLTQDEHLEQLRDQEGFVIHYSEQRTGNGWSVEHTRAAFPDGTYDPTDPPQVMIHGMDATLDAAEAMALAILAAVKEARS
ncbi:MAG: hypothetical protein Q7J48_20525 [Nocardioides sp.]|nr:hypothetical protein [Nocardioides sp.]